MSPKTQTTPSSGPIVREPMRWLFTAHFDDDTTIEQDQEDRSLTREGGSAFTDVLAKPGLIAFKLQATDTQEWALVDLTTGAFIVNGTPLNLHNQYFEPHKYPLEIVYFQETRIDQVLNEKGEELSIRHYTNRYFIGWKTEVNGKEKQVTLAVG